MTIEGLPEGVEIIRYGTRVLCDEFELDGGRIRQSVMNEWLHDSLIVRPAPGYRFVYDPPFDAYQVEKDIPATVITATVIARTLRARATALKYFDGLPVTVSEEPL